MYNWFILVRDYICSIYNILISKILEVKKNEVEEKVNNIKEKMHEWEVSMYSDNVFLQKIPEKRKEEQRKIFEKDYMLG